MHATRRAALLAGLSASIAGLEDAFAGPAEEIAAAYFFAFAPFEIARTFYAGNTMRNRLIHRRRLADASSRSVTTPNNDTLYSSAFLDLNGGPAALDIPDIAGRYFSVALMDAFTDNFQIFGTRTTGGRGGKFLLAGPGFRGAAPAGRTLVQCPTNDVWLLARILADDAADLPNVHKLQDGLVLAAEAAPTPFAVAPGDGTDAANFIDVANMMLARCGPQNAHVRRGRRFARYGVAPGRTFAKLHPRLQAGWGVALPRLRQALTAGLSAGPARQTGWSVPPAEIGNFGANDQLRAAIALGGLAALPPTEAMYLSTRKDASGADLSGANAYLWRLPPGGVPAGAFWSLSIYQIEADGRLFFTENPLNRFAIGDRTRGLQAGADGLAVRIQRAPPASEADRANWLPAPAGPFHLSLRAYLPKPELLSGAWAPPPVERV